MPSFHTAWMRRLSTLEATYPDSFKLMGSIGARRQLSDLFALSPTEAKIAALERMVGRQALEIEFLKGALKSGPRPRSATTSVITGPTASASPKDAV